MTIHKEGATIIPVTFVLLSAILFPVFFFFGSDSIWTWILAVPALVFFALVVSFFRSPKRVATVNANNILCPADGKVVVVERVTESEYFKDERIQVSVFMSPLNVHVNWYPIAGTVSYTKYHAGKFLVAWHPKSSELNERSTVVVKHAEKGEILLRQIAGAVARRIVTYSKEGDGFVAGDQLGFIKFGSRVDIFLPVTAKVLVKPGDVVSGIDTVLAQFNDQ